MSFIDNMDLPDGHTIGIFSIKSYDKDDNLIDEYQDKNLIVHSARETMAGLVGGWNSGTDHTMPINTIVLGTLGHEEDDRGILYPINVGDEQPRTGNLFDIERIDLFSEEYNDAAFVNYKIDFDVEGDVIKEDSAASGMMRVGKVPMAGYASQNSNVVKRTIKGDHMNETEYVVTVPIEHANLTSEVIAYTEAALYAGERLFAMKTFPARVKEDTVRFVITWTIVF